MASDIYVFGDAILDKTITVHNKGASPERLEAHWFQEIETCYNLGGAANVAAGIQALGGQATLLFPWGTCARSIERELLFSLLQDAGVCRDVFGRARGVPHVKTRIVADGQHKVRLDSPTPGTDLLEISPDPLAASCWRNVAEAPPAVCCLVNHNKGFLSVEALAHLKNALAGLPTTPVLVDPGKQGAAWEQFQFENALFKANESQCMAFLLYATNGDLDPFLAGWCNRDRSEEALCRFAYEVFRAARKLAIPCRYLVITFGKHGAVLCENRGGASPLSYVRPYAVDEVDPLGAGDTFLAALAWKFAETGCYDYETVKSACCLASKAASVAVTRPGVVVVTAADLA